MKKISLYVIIDLTFKFLLLFLLNLIWSLYFIKSAWISIIVSCIISVITLFVNNYIVSKKLKIKQPKLQETKHMEDVKNTFIYMPQSDIIDFFYKLANKKHKVNKTKKYVTVINDNKIIIFPVFKISILTSDEIIKIYNSVNKENVKKIIILCNQAEQTINNVLANFKTKTIILNYKQTYLELLKPYEFFPEIIVNTAPKQKNTLKQVFNIAFDKKRTKSYVISALFILFSSFFVKYKIYYLLVTSILIVCAFVCQFKVNKPQKEELLG